MKQAADALLGHVVALHPYMDEDGKCLFVRVRRSKVPKVMPMHFDMTLGKWVRGEPTAFPGIPEGKKPLYGIDRLKRAAPSEMVWLVEGEKCADSLTKLGILATTSGSASSCGKADWTPLKGQSVCIWPDLDDAGQRYALACLTALKKHGCTVRIIDAGKLGLREKGADCVDWLELHPEAKAPGETRKALEALPLLELKARAEPPPTVVLPEEAPIEQAKPIDPKILKLENDGQMSKIGSVTYVLKGDGLFAQEFSAASGGSSTIYLGHPLRILAHTRAADGGEWGRLVEWRDGDGRKHTVAIPVAVAYGDGGELMKFLSSQGWKGRCGRKVVELICNYLISWPVDARAACTARVGWIGNSYITPERVVGQCERERIVYQPSSTIVHGLSRKGNLDDWKENVAELARGNSRIMLTISAAFAGPLLRRTGTPGGGLHLYGDSSSGKSNAVRAAASVWGFHKDLMRQWRATDNGLEALAEAGNDGLLMLDEIKQLDARLVGAAAYMLANGQGKTRMTKGLVVRPPATWELIFLSSGEHTLQQMMLEVGQKSATGQALRIPSIPCDLGELGLVEDLHGFEDSKAFMQSGLEPAIADYYGHAGQAWLDKIVPDIDAISKRALELRDRFVTEAMVRSRSGQIARVATRFGIVAAAGELASSLGITGWFMGEAWNGVRQCFDAWLAFEGPTEEKRQSDLFARIRGIIEQGAAFFPELDTPIDRLPKGKILGYQRDRNGRTEFLVSGSIFRSEFCLGKNQNQVVEELKKNGILEPGSERLQQLASPKSGRQWFYVLNDKILEYESEKSGASIGAV
jgi:uncharacterized protein (DUF927 family)